MTDKLQELIDKRNKIEEAGGAKRVQKQHDMGKLTARERINLFFDEGTFVEIDAFVTHRCTNFDMKNTDSPAEGVITGYGKVEGRLAYAYAQDFTVVGGSLGEMHAAKIVKVMDMALKMGAPCVGMNDSGGARIQEGVDALKGYGQIFYRNTISSGVIPQISLIMGPCAGGAVYSPAITDFIFMVEKTSQMFITGPQVIKAVTGESVTAEDLGGANTHNKTSGVAHFKAQDDKTAIMEVRRLLSFLPSNNMERTPILENTDDPNKILDGLNEIIPENPNKAYDVKDIIKALVTDIDPDEQVKHAMNRINAAERKKTAAEYESEAQKIRIVAVAKAEAESKKLQGQGIADQRREIAKGLEESVKMLNAANINAQEASALIVVTQHYDTLQSIGANNRSNLVLLPNSPNSASTMLNDLMVSMAATQKMDDLAKK